MSSVKLIQMYASPWAERVRWVLNFKGLPYEKQNYQPGVDEEAVKETDRAGAGPSAAD
jgi:glutathione S-transferase